MTTPSADLCARCGKPESSNFHHQFDGVRSHSLPLHEFQEADISPSETASNPRPAISQGVREGGTESSPLPHGRTFRINAVQTSYEAAFVDDDEQAKIIVEWDEKTSRWVATMPEHITCYGMGTTQLHALASLVRSYAAYASSLSDRLAASQRDPERLDWLTRNISGSALRAIGVEWPAWSEERSRSAIDAAKDSSSPTLGGET